MKKLLLAATALTMLGTAASADAAVAVGVGISSPGYYYAPPPAPVYYAPAPDPYYYGPWGYDRRRDYDWYYWNRPGYHRHWVDNGWRNGVFVRGHWE